MQKSGFMKYVQVATAFAFLILFFLNARLNRHSIELYVGAILMLLACISIPYIIKQGLLFSKKFLLVSAAILSLSTISFLNITSIQTWSVLAKFSITAICFVLFFLFLAGFHFSLTQHVETKLDWTPAQVFGSVGLLCFAGLFLQWIFYFPSGTSPDTLYQWQQIHGIIPYTDIHAIGHTLFLKALLSIYDSYAIVIFAHILMISLLYAFFAAYIFKKGIDFRFILALTVLFISCLSMSTIYMYPWKDTPYTVCLGIITLFMMKTLEQENKFGLGKIALLGAALAFSVLLRYNGIIAFVLCTGYFVWYFIKSKSVMKILCLASVIVVLMAGVNLYAHTALKVESSKNGFSVQVFGSGIAAIVANEGNITKEQYEHIDSILPIKWMKENYKPWNTKALIWTKQTKNSFFISPEMDVYNNNFVLALGEHKKEVIRLYFQLLPRNLGICIRDVLYNTYVIWGFSDTPFFFENAFLLILLFVSLRTCWNTKAQKKYWIVFLPVLCNVISVAISTITNEHRYLLPTFTLFPFLMLYVFSIGKNERKITLTAQEEQVIQKHRTLNSF